MRENKRTEELIIFKHSDYPSLDQVMKLFKGDTNDLIVHQYIRISKNFIPSFNFISHIFFSGLSEAAVILGPHGGAFYNILYAPRKTLVIEFFPVRPGSMLSFLPLPRQQQFFFNINITSTILRNFFNLVVLIIIIISPSRFSTQVARSYLVACALPRPALLPGTELIHTYTHRYISRNVRTKQNPYFRTNY